MTLGIIAGPSPLVLSAHHADGPGERSPLGDESSAKLIVSGAAGGGVPSSTSPGSESPSGGGIKGGGSIRPSPSSPVPLPFDVSSLPGGRPALERDSSTCGGDV